MGICNSNYCVINVIKIRIDNEKEKIKFLYDNRKVILYHSDDVSLVQSQVIAGEQFLDTMEVTF